MRWCFASTKTFSVAVVEILPSVRCMADAVLLADCSRAVDQRPRSFCHPSGEWFNIRAHTYSTVGRLPYRVVRLITHDRVQVNAFLRRCMKLGYRERDAPSIEEIFAMTDDQLFSKINSNSLHILQQFMPDRPSLNYSLRARPHNKTLIAKTTQLNGQDFIIRSIYKDSY